MKKVLSLILALAMMLSMVTFAHADEPAAEAENITIDYWNANTSALVIQLSEAVTQEELAAAVTLKTSAGATVALSGVYANATAPESSTHTQPQQFVQRENGKYNSVRKLTANSNIYTIVPADGFAFDTEYSLTISEELLGATTKLNFTVTKFFVDNFDVDAWGTNSTVSNGKILCTGGVHVDNNDNNIFADTGKGPKSYRTSAASTGSKINIEIDARAIPSQAGVAYGVGAGIVSRIDTKDITYQKVAMFKFGANTAGDRVIGAGIAANLNETKYPFADSGIEGTEYKTIQANLSPDLKNNYPEHVSKPITLDSKESNLAGEDYIRLAMLFDDDAHKLVLGWENDYYAYSYDMTNASGATLLSNSNGWMPYLVTENGVKLSVDKLIASKATGNVVIVRTTNIDGPVDVVPGVTDVTVKFAQPILVSELQNKIKIFDGEEEVASTITKLAETDTDGNYVYKLAVAGFEYGKTYRLTMAAGEYNDENSAIAVLQTPYTRDFEPGYVVTTVAEPTWTAASDTMTLIFATDLTTDLLADAIILTDEDGNDVDVTVTKLTDVTKAAYASGKFSYRINLPERFNSGETYTLRIAPVDLVDDSDATTLYLLEEEYILNFKVDLLVVEEFNYTEGDVAGTDGESTFAWNIATNTNRNGTMTIKKDNEDNMYAEVTASGKTYFAPYANNDVNFANTEMDGYAYSNNADYVALSDYTTEIDLKVVSSTDAEGQYDFRLDQTRMAYSTAYNTGYNESMVGMQVWKTKTPSYLMRPAGHSLEKGGNFLTYSQQSTGKAALWPVVGSNDYMRVAMYSEGNNFRFWVGDSITNIEGFTYAAPPGRGIPAMWFNSDGDIDGTVVYHIDNLILSKASEVETPSTTRVDCIAVTAGDEEIDSLVGMDTVDVAVDVTRTGVAGPVKAVLAIYKANGEMANVIMSEITALTLGTTTFEFTDVEVNGGETLSVFFWNSFETLIPYTNPALFPADE